MTDFAPRTIASESMGVQSDVRAGLLRRPNRHLSLYDEESAGQYGEISPQRQPGLIGQQIHEQQLYRQQLHIVGTTEEEIISSVVSPIGRMRMMRAHQQTTFEMVNPDGSVTVKNLVLRSDGKGSKIVEEHPYYLNETNRQQLGVSELGGADSNVTDYFEDEDDRFYYESRGRPRGAGAVSNKEGTTSAASAGLHSSLTGDVPALAPANSFESSASSSTMRTAKSRSDGSEVSEGAAHELRRQRLTKSRLPLPVSGRKHRIMDSIGLSAASTPPRSPPKTTSLAVGSTPSPSPVRSRSSASEQLMTYIPANLTSPPRPIRMTRPLTTAMGLSGVGFMTNIVATSSDDGETSFTNDDIDGAIDAGDSLGYPAFDGSTYDSVMSTDNSSIFDILGASPKPDPRRGRYSPSSSMQAQAELLHVISQDNDPCLVQGDLSVHSSDVAGNLEDILGPPPITSNWSKSRVPVGSLFIAEESDMDEMEGDQEEVPYVHMVTVHKATVDEKIGIFVGLKHLPEYGGIRLVVSKIAPDGKFANSGIDVGDVVVSINGKSFVETPSSQDAFGRIDLFNLGWFDTVSGLAILHLHPHTCQFFAIHPQTS